MTSTLDTAPDPDFDLDQFAGRVQIFDIKAVQDSRGTLVEFDHSKLPFLPQRTFFIRDVPAGVQRGGHAHQLCEQLLICLRGNLLVDLIHGICSAQIVLNRPNIGLYISAQVWARQTYQEANTELLVFASLPYDPAEYIAQPMG